MPAQFGDKNTRYFGDQFQSKKGYIHRNTWAAPAAASGTAIHAAINSAAVVTTGITNPDFARLLSVVGAGSGHNAAGTVTINGTDIRDAVIADTLTLNGNTTVNSVKAFKTVTSLDFTAVTGNDVNNTVSVGIGAKLGLSRCCSVDSAMVGNSDGTFEATRPVITYDSAVISKNVVNFNTAPNAAHNFAVVFETEELYSGK